MLLAACVLFVLLALLSLSASEGPRGRERARNTLIGALAVGAVVLVLARAGLGWAGMVVALLWAAARRVHLGSSGRPRTADAPPPPPPRDRPPKQRMTRDEAFAVLGLEPGASRERILAEYRRLMKKVHPDVGGTTYLATQLNEAKDRLVGDES